MKTGRQRLKQAALVALGLAVAVFALDRLFPPDMTRAQTLSPEVTDRDGALLRAFLSKDGALAHPHDARSGRPRAIWQC